MSKEKPIKGPSIFKDYVANIIVKTWVDSSASDLLQEIIKELRRGAEAGQLDHVVSCKMDVDLLLIADAILSGKDFNVAEGVGTEVP